MCGNGVNKKIILCLRKFKKIADSLSNLFFVLNPKQKYAIKTILQNIKK